MILQGIIIAILIGIVAYLVYKNYTLKKGIRNFNPVVVQNETNIIQIGDIRMFTKEEEEHLATYKDVLKLILKQLDYRISTYTTIQNTCYRPNGRQVDGQVIYDLKSDSEKWMETGRMNGYIDVRADIQHLIAKEDPTKPQNPT